MDAIILEMMSRRTEEKNMVLVHVDKASSYCKPTVTLRSCLCTPTSNLTLQSLPSWFIETKVTIFRKRN